MSTNEDYRVRQIPDNFGNGINIGGMHFPVIFLVEGVILAIIFLLLTFGILKLLGMTDIGQIFGICLVFSGIALVVGIKGINDEPITVFLKNLSDFRKGRRTAFYNPRIKLEAKSVLNAGENDAEIIPKEKIMAALSKYKEKAERKEQEKAKAYENSLNSKQGDMFFEDDIGIVKKPQRYFSEKEDASFSRKKGRIKRFKEKNLN